MARRSSKFLNESVAELESNETGTKDGGEELSGKKMSKAAAARATLADGIVLPRKAVIHMKEKYGIDITPQQFSAEKCRLNTRAAETGQMPSYELSSRRADLPAESTLR